MKNYREVTDDLIRQRNIYERRRTARVRKTVVVATFVLVCGVFGSGAWLLGSEMMNPNESIGLQTEEGTEYTDTDNEDSENASADTTEQPKDEYNIIEIPLQIGMGEQYKVDSSKLPDVLFDTTNMKVSYPVYICKYPIDPYNGFLFEIGDEEMTLMNNTLDNFLPLLYNENEIAELSEREYNDINYSLSVYDDNIQVMATVNGVSIAISDYLLTENDILNKTLDNIYLKAVCDYMGFDNISCTKTESAHDHVNTEYYITNADIDPSVDPAYNMFNYISVTVYEDIKTVSIMVYDIDYSPEQIYEISSIPFGAITNYVKNIYSAIDTSDIKVTMNYNNSAVPGYYVPCYRLYMGSIDENDPLYTVTDIVAVDIELDENGEIIK